MASKLIVAQHNCKELLKFILPDDMATVDLEVMTLTGAYVYKRDKNCIEKRFLPWSKENTLPPEFLRKVRETQGQRTKEFLDSLLDQDLVPKFSQNLPVNVLNLLN